VQNGDAATIYRVPLNLEAEGLAEIAIRKLRLHAPHPPQLEAALKARDMAQLTTAIGRASETCNACHKAAQRGFIEVPAEPGAPVPRFERTP